MRIHPQAIDSQAIVSPKARIGQDVKIGPFCVIEDDAVIGDGCCLEPRVTIKQGVQLGENNHLFEGATIGGIPQCVGLNDVCGHVVIGNGNIIRENVTVHRSMTEADATEIGDNCMFMVNAHIAHDCRIGDNVIMANNTMLAGHVTVGRRAFISGAVGVHQFCRIGAYAMVGGQAHIVRDIPPYVTVDGLSSQVVGLNLIGLRRAGFSTEEIKTLKELYRILYKSNLPWRDVVKHIQEEFVSGPGLEMASFLSTTTRGITKERRSDGHIERFSSEEEPSTVRLHLVDEEGERHSPVVRRRNIE